VVRVKTVLGEAARDGRKGREVEGEGREGEKGTVGMGKGGIESGAGG
jgi:hypothetical protein